MINDETLTGAITFNKEITIDGDGHFVTAKVTGTDDMLVVNSNSSNYNMFINNSTGTLLKDLTIYGGRKSAIVNNKDKRYTFIQMYYISFRNKCRRRNCRWCYTE